MKRILSVHVIAARVNAKACAELTVDAFKRYLTIK